VDLADEVQEQVTGCPVRPVHILDHNHQRLVPPQVRQARTNEIEKPGPADIVCPTERTHHRCVCRDEFGERGADRDVRGTSRLQGKAPTDDDAGALSRQAPTHLLNQTALPHASTT
jgi:hypothetical protein